MTFFRRLLPRTNTMQEEEVSDVGVASPTPPKEDTMLGAELEAVRKATLPV